MLEGKKLFENVEWDEEGRYLLMHQHGAGKYYKLNVVFLLLFLGTTIFTYKKNSVVFWNDKFAKLYLGVVISSILGLYIFANKHIQTVYLLKGQQNIGIYTYSNFGFSYNRMRTIPV